MRIGLLLTAFVVVSGTAQAQSPYVAATIGADVLRVDHAESNFSSGGSADSEVVSWSLRVGTDVGQNWGTELEFVHSQQSHSSGLPVSPLADISLTFTATTPNGIIPSLPVAFTTDVRRSHSDFDAAVWARQRVRGSVDLVYLGGVAFSRERTEITQTFPTGIIRPLVPIPSGGFRSTIIDYSARPLVGTEARIGLTSHVRLMPGIRLQGASDGWLLRPYAGLGWFF